MYDIIFVTVNPVSGVVFQKTRKFGMFARSQITEFHEICKAFIRKMGPVSDQFEYQSKVLANNISLDFIYIQQSIRGLR